MSLHFPANAFLKDGECMKKNSEIKIYLTNEEKEIATKFADACGVSLSSLSRSLLLGFEPKKLPPEIFWKLICSICEVLNTLDHNTDEAKKLIEIVMELQRLSTQPDKGELSWQ
jgi:hypothetical protein